MDEAVFQRCLSQYKVVRKSNHCRIAWNRMKVPDSAKDSIDDGTATEQANQENERKTFLKKLKDQESFTLSLKMFLQEYFGPLDAEKIIARTQQAQKLYVNSLSLDDIENICKASKAI